ncbi:MAG: CPBP family intramembrane metalloprotease [Pyrinomonadaceae bacterium]|nr:CPBP family intramembrane metalloprotease [Pyrinomonadaceae bacterium]
MDSSLIAILLAFAFAALSAVIALRFYWTVGRTGVRMPRATLSSGYQILAQQAVVLAVILAFGYFSDLNLNSLGYSSTVGPLLAFVLGLAIYGVVLVFVEVASHFLGIRERLHDLSYETMRLIWPRNPEQKLAAFAGVCIMNPFTEEVLFRGVLVFLLGEYTGNFILAAVIGLLLSLAAHMYQGGWSIPFQLVFHATAVLIVLSPLGLVACIGFHFAGDLVPVMLLKKSMIEWRNRNRNRKSYVT